MPKSPKEFKVLDKRIKQLEKHFNFKQSINGISDLQLDKLKSLVILCHAEIEVYLENIALNLIIEAEKQWDSNKTSNYNLSSLFIYSERISNNGTCCTKSKKIIADYRSMIKYNHVIKEENIKKLFIPLGYEIDDFDVAFLSTLSSFGVLRGETAHSSAMKMKQQLDQKTVLHMVEEILVGISDFELVIKSK
jgi:hypothetical protein